MPFRVRAVLVASDLSETATVVVRAAGALAALAEAELHAVHAVEPGGRDGESSIRELEDARAALRAQLRGALPPSIESASVHVVPGRAHEVILRRAAEVAADLLVIGPHDGRQESGAPLGTTADRLVRTSDLPCLVLREPLSLPLRRILVPSDLSEAAEGALDVAFIWGAALRMPAASGEETRLDVIHSLAAVSEQSAVDLDAEAERGLREQVAAVEARTGCGGLMKVATAVIHSAGAADAILRFARENQPDLLVLGTHGQSALVRALVGSVSSAVARRAERPVLLVPPGYWKSWRRRNEALQDGSSV
jgi:universal stress protein E